MTSETVNPPPASAAVTRPAKLHGRAFYESIGSPKYIVAPMVDQSEFAWRMLTRSFMSESERPSVLAYSPMLHARLFADSQKYRDSHFQPTRASMLPTTPDDDTPYLDGNAAIDRPLFVQFCANNPQALLEAAKLVAPYCDAVDLNFGCPQGIARKGHYGAFLQEDQALVHSLVRTLHENLPIPVTAKIRILDTKEETLAYARNVLAAGASILTVHGRRREQKGHLTGVADWGYIRYLRDNLPPETVLFANGNVLQHEDLQRCLDATGADGVMSAEGNLSNPALFAAPPSPAVVGEEGGREYWRGKDGRGGGGGGWRVDAVVRRYLDIMHRYVVGQEPPARRALFVPGDDASWLEDGGGGGGGRNNDNNTNNNNKPSRSARMTSATAGPNFVAMQAHLFHLLRHLVTRHTDVRDALARSRLGDIAVYERILDMVERKVAEGLLEYEATGGKSVEGEDDGRNGAYAKGSRGGGGEKEDEGEEEIVDDPDSSVATVRRCKRPWWVVQPIVRPLPKEAMAKGAISLSKKDKQKLAEESLLKKDEVEEKEDKATVRGPEDAAAAAAATNGQEANGDGTKTGHATEMLEKTTRFPDSNLVSG
ncbi:FMN-linked oxidoreductase [Cryphonectria parasitica EP155]|uniref:tRNA-dihydrouridine(16/17) synthase [NAD(P)(+)] n=1 Tax=Cryphonectria parasitica (strain ATCC 38755 / EP155) TaxID=660469 RepID=A0A9P4YC08_CRYP1|nr:FMN-linked oxidoreductase [Cryphonectria parasitica EP155]KAF3769890.1 FMN-linked oxidoreductase [Cryphonectria parasitica EP155]